MNRDCSDRLFDLMEEGVIDPKKLAQSLIYWISEHSIRDFIRENDIELDDPEPEEPEEWYVLDSQSGNLY